MSMEQPRGPVSPRPTSHKSRNFSFGAKSDKSSGKVDLTESPKDKNQRDSVWKATHKSNPNAAMSEAQPGVAAYMEQSTLDSLRGVQHKDVHGNVISEPDLANPTRPRWERPLDTIRSFENAIDHGYKRRSSMRSGRSNAETGLYYARTERLTDIPETFDPNNQYASRRSSYFGGHDGGTHSPSGRQSVMSGGGYYGARPQSHMDNQQGSSRSRYGQRMQSESGMRYANGGGPVYPQHSYHQSHDTVNTTNGSDSTGPWANSTDPSSENSSIDRVNAVAKPNPQDPYAQNGQFQGPILEEYGPGSYGGAYPQNGGSMPTQPPTAANQPRRPIPLGGNPSSSASYQNSGGLPSAARQEPEKKKSWLKRRFSKND